MIAGQLLAEFRENHDVDDVVFSSMARLDFAEPAADTVFISDTNDVEVGTVSNISFMR